MKKIKTEMKLDEIWWVLTYLVVILCIKMYLIYGVISLIAIIPTLIIWYSILRKGIELLLRTNRIKKIINIRYILFWAIGIFVCTKFALTSNTQFLIAFIAASIYGYITYKIYQYQQENEEINKAHRLLNQLYQQREQERKDNAEA